MGFSILPRNSLCSIMIFRFRLGFRGLSPYCSFFSFPWKPVINFRFPLVPDRVPGLVSLFSFLFSGKGFCSIMSGSGSFWFLLVPARAPGLVSLLFSSFLSQDRDCFSSFFPGSFWFRLRFRVCLSSFLLFLLSGATDQ